MTTRHERVVVEGVDNYSGVLAKMAAETRAFRRELDGNSRAGLPSFRSEIRGMEADSRKANAELGRVSGSVQRLGPDSRRAGSEIDRLSGRVRLLVDVLSLVGPAGVPIAAVLVPALTGLSTIAAVSAVTLGSMIASLQGVGDALKAVDAYQLEPTAANLEKMQQALGQLSPDARALVAALDDVQPMLRELRDAGAEAWAPGLIRSLEAAQQLQPELEGIMRAAGESGGEALADGIDSLGSERWAEMWQFWEAETRQNVPKIARTVGDLTHGLSELLIAADPGSDAFVDWLGDVADGFDEYAGSEAGREDLRAIIDYVRENGPEVAAFAGSLANSTAQVVQAIAPWGGPTLTILTAVSDAMGAIADSDLGTPIMGGVIALAAYNRLLAVTNSLQTSAFGRSAAGQAAGRSASAFVGGRLGGVSDLRSLPATYREVAAAQRQVMVAQDRFNSSRRTYVGQLQAQNRLTAQGYAVSAGAQQRLTDSLGRTELANYGVQQATDRARIAEQQRSAALRRGFAAAGRGAALAGALAVATTSAGDSLGYTNTAALGLAGTMAGPWGAAAGAVIGLGLDWRAANAQVADSIDEVDRAMAENAGNLAGQRGVVRGAIDDYNEWAETQQKSRDGLGNFVKSRLDPTVLTNEVSEMAAAFGIGTSQADEQTAALDRAEAQYDNAQRAAAALGRELGDNIGPVDGSVRSLNELQAVLDRAAPAMDRLGISQAQLTASSARGQLSPGSQAVLDLFGGPAAEDFGALTARIRREMVAMESEGARIRSVGDAFAKVTSDAYPLAEAVVDVRENLAALLNPALNAEAATDAWRASLRELRNELNATAGFEGQSQAAQDNRSRTRDYVQGVQERLAALAEAGASEEVLARAVRRSRREFIESGVAAGFSRKEIRARSRELGLTPKLVETIIRALGIDQADLNARSLRRAYNQLPEAVQTVIREQGSRLTVGKINQLLEKYELTEKQRTALITLRDMVRGKLPGIVAALNNIDGKTATTYVDTIHRTFNRGPNVRPDIPLPGSAEGNIFAAYAGGGLDKANAHRPEFAGPGLTRVWREPETGGESYIPHRDDHRRPRARAIAEQTVNLFGGRVAWFAQGGQVGARAQEVGARASLVRAAGTTVVRVGSEGPMEISGWLETPWGPAEVAGVAEAAALKAIDDEADFARRHGGGR